MPAPEYRYLKTAGLRVETRGEGGPPLIAGYAAVFDEWTVIYESKTYLWREMIRPGAFKNALAEGQDVPALFNHDSNFILGRTSSGTARLTEDSRGLAYEIEPPNTPLVRDLVLYPIQRGDVKGSSFAFTIRPGGSRLTVRDEEDRRIEEVELLDLDLFDVSPVTYPAYEQTSVALRALGKQRDRELREQRAARLIAAGERLQRYEALYGR